MGWYPEVFDILFADLDQEAARKVWQKALTKPEGKKGDREEVDDE